MRIGDRRISERKDVGSGLQDQVLSVKEVSLPQKDRGHAIRHKHKRQGMKEKGKRTREQRTPFG